MAAQTSVGLALGAFVWSRRMRPWPAAVLFLCAIALAVAAPVEPDFLRGMGAKLDPEHLKNVLRFAALTATVAAAVTRQWRLVLVALLGEAALWPITSYVQECDPELAAAHLAFFGLLVGLYVPVERVEAPSSNARGATGPRLEELGRDDAVAFAAGTLAGLLACWLVLRGGTDSADEWAYTFQSALFAKLRAYGSVPHCSEAFRSFWVFQYLGRSFAQYTPGWSFVMTPFVALHAAWLAGPASLGLLASGAARLARRAAAGVAAGHPSPPAAHVRAAGAFAALAVSSSSMLVINGGSRYPHVFVAALWAWSIEAVCVLTVGGLPRAERRAEQRAWGAILGACAGLLVATRPGDACTLGFGVFLYFLYALVRRRPGWQGVAVAAGVAAFIGGLTLLVLRLQLGQWFKTGYSLTETFYPWSKVAWSLPKPNEYRWGLPLGSGSYCWWPCSPAIGLAGLAVLRGRARRLAFMLFFGAVPLTILYTLLELGRGFDFGYGPRYELPLVVPMAVGTGVVFATLWTRALARSTAESPLQAGGPAALALAAAVLGVVRIAPLVYPFNYADVHSHNRLHEAIDTIKPHHAVVFGGLGLNTTDPMDLTENLPLDLYPDQDVIIAIDRGPDEDRCVQTFFRGWNFYRAIPGDPVRLVRY